MKSGVQRRSNRPPWLYRRWMAMMGRFEFWLNLSCQSFIRLASEKHERPLRLRERWRQGIHRAICHLCRLQEKRMEQLHRLTHEIANYEGKDTDVMLSPVALERIRQAMGQAVGRQ